MQAQLPMQRKYPTSEKCPTDSYLSSRDWNETESLNVLVKFIETEQDKSV